MGTPLKTVKFLSSSKVLSPLSPLNVIFKTPTSAKKSAKKLKFSPSPSKSDLCKIVVTNYDKNVGEFEHNKEPLLINTPNKKHLLKNGATERSKMSILGQGTFGTVIKGKYQGKFCSFSDNLTQLILQENNVAVKIAKAKHVRGEANVLNLSHENIAKVLNVISGANEKYCLVLMEYLPEAVQLSDVLENNNVMLNDEKVIKYAKDICEGLAFCHKNEILHLDLKPSNILLCQNDVCKLCDFGNSCKFEDAREGHQHLGTVAYTAPEIFLGKCPTVKSDVYSLGIIFWQLRYRLVPYENIDNNQTLIYRVVKTNLRPDNLIELTKNDEYYQLYKKCWESEPKIRPNTEEVSKILNEIVYLVTC